MGCGWVLGNRGSGGGGPLANLVFFSCLLVASESIGNFTFTTYKVKIIRGKLWDILLSNLRNIVTGWASCDNEEFRKILMFLYMLW